MEANLSPFESNIISDATLWIVPSRWTRRDIVVLKFGGTTAGASQQEGRIRLARNTISDLIDSGKSVVPVFSAFRRGRSQSKSKVSVTDILQTFRTRILQAPRFEQGVASFHQELTDIHFGLIEDLQLADDAALQAQVTGELERVKNTAVLCCTAYEQINSLEDSIVTAGERLVVMIIAAYLTRLHEHGKFAMRAAPATAMELGIYTDNNFGSANINWASAVENAREVIFGKYFEQNILPIVTGFDGIYDPSNEFQQMMRAGSATDDDAAGTRIFRTSLGRGGSDLTATFLGLALDAEYVGFCKETPGVLTADDKLVGDRAKTLRKIDYDLATEAGNIYSRAVEPVRAGNVPVHIFDPICPDQRTVICDAAVPAGLYIVERPIETVNVHVGTIPDEPGTLSRFLHVFAENHVNVEEVRHQRSGTDCIVVGREEDIQSSLQTFSSMGLRLVSQFSWYMRAIGVVTEELAAEFNQFMSQYEPLSLATYQLNTRVLTATIARNRAGMHTDEVQRAEAIATQLHDSLVATNPIFNKDLSPAGN